MADPYQPALESFALTENENSAIAGALETDDPWAWKSEDEATRAALKSAKSKILAFHLERHNGHCCYCRVNLAGAGPFMTDREHILPKGQNIFKPYSYTMWNLAAACKRCNMQFKGVRDDFVIDKEDPAALQVSENYKLIHPNFDLYEAHLIRHSAQAGTKSIVCFHRTEGSAKAEFTYDFFSLNKLAIDSFDQAQGLATGTDSHLAVLVRKLAEDYDQ